ncbi:MAG TPA: hypothetical protein VFZ76_19310 [Anaerolineales bacterium]
MNIKPIFLSTVTLAIVLVLFFPTNSQVNAHQQNRWEGSNLTRIYQQASEVCYAIADHGGGPPGDDLLTQVDFLSGVETVIGSPGTSNMEAITFQAPTETLFGVDADQLGTLDLSTGAFTPTSDPFGTANGAFGNQVIDDVDSLGFDPLTGILYGANRIRRPEADILIQIDPNTGRVLPDAFGPGVGYVRIPTVNNLNDIDDIAIDPIDGQMYGTQNSGGQGDRLVKIDKQTGVTIDIGSLGINDMEGLTFDPSGQLLGTTGRNGPADTNNRLYRIDKVTGLADFVTSKPLTAATDYEGVSCLTSWPTAVEMVYFQAETTHGRQITLSWLLAAEIDNIGFNLYRANENDLSKAEWIAFVQSAGGSAGNRYTHSDTVPSSGTWYYWVADVDTNGHETYHGPVAVVAMNQVFLPLTIH